MSTWYRNGKPVDSVAVDDRALQYGDGLFETIAIREGKARLFERHMQRLARGCACLGLESPDVAAMEHAVAQAVEQSQELSAYCVAKIIVGAGVSQRGYGRARPTQPSILVGAFPARPVPAEAYHEGVDTMLCRTRLAVHSPTAGLKTLNRIEQVLARSECVATGAFEGLTLDAEDRLICGTMSNVFLVADKKIITPSLHRCGVEGVMRNYAIETLQREGFDLEVRDHSIEEFRNCDEIFLTNSQFGALPVRHCDGVTWPKGTVTDEVMTVLADNGIAECAA